MNCFHVDDMNAHCNVLNIIDSDGMIPPSQVASYRRWPNDRNRSTNESCLRNLHIITSLSHHDELPLYRRLGNTYLSYSWTNFGHTCISDGLKAETGLLGQRKVESRGYPL